MVEGNLIKKFRLKNLDEKKLFHSRFVLTNQKSFDE